MNKKYSNIIKYKVALFENKLNYLNEDGPVLSYVDENRLMDMIRKYLDAFERLYPNKKPPSHQQILDQVFQGQPRQIDSDLFGRPITYQPHWNPAWVPFFGGGNDFGTVPPPPPPPSNSFQQSN